jgi:maleylpyruvate isomerase
MSITVYNISGSPMGWRVLLGLEFKGLKYRTVYLSGSDREHKLDPFLQMNPHGKVPVLEHEGIYHRESLAILGWLDEQFPERPLFGNSIPVTQQTWRTTARLSDYLLKSTSGVVFSVFNGEDGSPKIEPEGDVALDQAGELLKTELHDLEHHLGGRPFLCGDRPSAADAVAFPEIGRIMRACQTKPRSMETLGFAAFDQDFPRIARWRDRIIALPGHARTVPPHWASTS